MFQNHRQLPCAQGRSRRVLGVYPHVSV